jgi:hypothetical protein
MKKQELMKTSPDYDANVSRWQFYLRSYLGGEDYADGNYLTAYIAEDQKEYQKRINSTPCDNHCKNIVQIYNSFIWRIPPARVLPRQNKHIDNFIKDADMDGRSFNAFMREAGAWASVYGHCWVIVDKPSSTAETVQDELDQEIRPYVTAITPENIMDWRYERKRSGRYELSLLKVRELADGDMQLIRVWTRETITLYKLDSEKLTIVEEMDNPIKTIPAVILYSARSPVRGVGISDITDIADFQKAIYSELSEVEQLIRITNHPSLAKTESTDASAGAGGIVTMSDDMDAGLRPFLLQPSSGSLQGVQQSIDSKVESINKISHMGGVRATEKQAKSGVALQTEFQLLNTRLSEKADLLELAEEQIWKLFNIWQNTNDEIIVDYPDSFDIRDHEADLMFLQTAKASGVPSKLFIKEIDSQIARLVIDDGKIEPIIKEIAEGEFSTQSTKEIFGYHMDGGVVTKNEVRTQLGLELTPDGDTFMESENTKVDSSV